MKIAIHQANLIPWFPFFYKMAMADKFVLLISVQFEKNNYQNRYKLSDGTWVTKSVNSGNVPISEKTYTDGQSLMQLNIEWIEVIKNTLDIKTEIILDDESDNTGTQRLIDLVKINGGNTYITNPEAKEKYLDEELMRNSGISIEYCKVPKNLQKHTFEMFHEHGIDGTIKHLPKRKNEIFTSVL